MQLFIRTAHRSSRFLLVCASLAIFGCGPQGPDIYSIMPDFCTRQRVSVGDRIARYMVGSTMRSLTDYSKRSGNIYYHGIEGSRKIIFSTHVDTGYFHIDLDNLHKGKGLLVVEYNSIGENGEIYLLQDQFYLVIYSASANYLDYTLQKSRATLSSWEPIPCAGQK